MAGEVKIFEGTNMWFDLPTSDSSGARDFYGALFGWEWLEVPMGDDMTYSMAMLGDKHIAAIFPEHGVQRKPGSPMMWMHHFWSYDVRGAATARVPRGRVRRVVSCDGLYRVLGVCGLLRNHHDGEADQGERSIAVERR